MSQADALLASLSETPVIHEHIVTDRDNRFVIDPDTRTIMNTSAEQSTLMQFDHCSETLTFELPRYIEGHDMTLCNEVYVHFNNINATATEANEDSAQLTDLAVDPEDPAKLICTWCIRREATQLAGTLNFLVQFMCVKSGEEPSYEWHTDIYDGIIVKPGRNNGNPAILPYSNILQEWHTRLFGAKDSLISDLEAAAEALKADIVKQGQETLETIPGDYTDAFNMAEEAVRKKADAIVLSAEGECIFVNDASDNPLLGLKLYGKTTQVNTTGAQMFDPATAVIGLLEVDGSVTTDGAYVTSDYIPVKPKTAYSQTRKDSVRCKYYDADKVALSDTWDTQLTGAGTFTTPANAYYMRTTVSVKVIGFFMLNEGMTALPYEPYSGGTVSPNPDWPQELKSIENSTTKAIGANLVPFLTAGSKRTGNGLTLEVYDDRCVCYGTPKNTYSSPVGANVTLPRGVYIVSGGEMKDGAVYLQVRVVRNGVDYHYLEGDVFTIYGDESTIAITVQVGNTTEPVDNYVLYPMLNVGETALEYEAYKSGGTLALERSLPGIPVSSGGNYTDANGQQWICDEVDFERGVYVQRIGDVTLNEHKTYKINNFQLSSKGRYMFEYYPGNLTNVEQDVPVMSDKLIRDKWGNFDNNETRSTVYCLSGRIAVHLSDQTIQTINAFKEYVTTNPIRVLYALETPIETPLTDEEISKFKMVRTNYHNTTVLNDSGAHMAVKYNADTLIFLRDNQPKLTDDQVQSAVNQWLEEHFSSAEGVSF